MEPIKFSQNHGIFWLNWAFVFGNIKSFVFGGVSDNKYLTLMFLKKVKSKGFALEMNDH